MDSRPLFYRQLACLALLRSPIVSTILLLATPSLGAPQPERPRAFVHAEVIPMESQAILSDHTVIVRGDRIVGLGPSPSTPIPRGALIIDATGDYLTPGLADLHVHIEEDETEDLTLLLAHGVTTVRLMNTHRPWPLHLAERIRKGEVEGPEIFCVPTIGSTDDPEYAKRFVEEMARRGFDSVKVQTDQPNWTAESYRAYVEKAHELGLRVVGHLPRGLDLEASIRGGQACVAHAEEFLYAHFNKLPEAEREAAIPEVAEMVSEEGVAVMGTLVTYKTIVQMFGDEIFELAKLPELATMPRDVRDRWSPENNRYRKRAQGDPKRLESAKENLRRGLALQRKLMKAFQDAGVLLLLGTDSSRRIPFVVHGYATHRELQEVADSGLTPYQTLRTATVNAAEYFQQREEFGRIAVGLRADLLLVKGNPLEDVGHLADRVGVMVRGRWHPQEELDARVRALVERRSSSPTKEQSK